MSTKMPRDGIAGDEQAFLFDVVMYATTMRKATALPVDDLTYAVWQRYIAEMCSQVNILAPYLPQIENGGIVTLNIGRPDSFDVLNGELFLLSPVLATVIGEEKDNEAFVLMADWFDMKQKPPMLRGEVRTSTLKDFLTATQTGNPREGIDRYFRKLPFRRGNVRDYSQDFLPQNTRN